MDDPEADIITLTTQGRFYRKQEGYYLVYDETELTGLTGTRTTVKATPDVVSVTRSGKYPSMMVFERDKRHMSLYNTGYGDVTISMATRSIQNSLTDEGGRIEINYDIELQHAYLSSNTLTIDVKPRDISE